MWRKSCKYKLHYRQAARICLTFHFFIMQYEPKCIREIGAGRGFINYMQNPQHKPTPRKKGCMRGI